MNPEKIGKNIAKLLLMEEITESVALYPGAFKPPHKGHVDAILKSINFALNHDRKINGPSMPSSTQTPGKAIVFVSEKTRENVDFNESLAVWDLYKEVIPELNNVEFISTPTPVKAVYDYVKENPTHDIKAVFGKGEESRYERLLDKEKYPTVELFDVGTFQDLSATDLRRAIVNKDREEIKKFIPDGVDVNKFLDIFNSENENLNEGPQFGVLYHFTQYLSDVLDDNILRGPISLTRSLDSYAAEWLGDQPYFILDKDKLRTKYKIRPFKDTSDNPDYEEISQYDEMEEVIDTDIINLSKYIIKVVLPHSDEEWEDALKEKGIPYEIGKPLNEAVVGDKIECDNCDWSWDIVSGGDDLFVCHKCGHDNSPTPKPGQLNEGWEPQKARTINKFLHFTSDYLKTDRPQIKLLNGPEFTQTYHSFGGYHPGEEYIQVVVYNRNMADILRTLAHEMVHRMQHLDNRLGPDSGNDGSPEENEANSLAAVIMRKFGRENPGIYE